MGGVPIQEDRVTKKRSARAPWRRCPSGWPLSVKSKIMCERHRWHLGRHRGGNRSWSVAPTAMVQCTALVGMGLSRQCDALAIEGYPFCLRHLQKAAARAHAMRDGESALQSDPDGRPSV